MKLPRIIIHVTDVILKQLSISPQKDTLISISLWDFKDPDRENNLIPKDDLKKILRALEEKECFEIVDINCLDKLGRFAEEAIQLNIDRKKFDNFCKQTEQQDIGNAGPKGVYYNPNTGVGYAYSKRFKFKNDQSDFLIFAEMYKNINCPVSRNEILKMIGYEEIGAKDTMATYKINEVVKKMRNMTGLNTDQIANNNGDLTLVGEKLSSPPK